MSTPYFLGEETEARSDHSPERAMCKGEGLSRKEAGGF